MATISGLSVHRQDTSAAAEGESPDAAAGDTSQQHQLLLWPQCGECAQPLLQAALDVAQPWQQMELQLAVLPSTMPAELLMTHQGEVWGGQQLKLPSCITAVFLRVPLATLQWSLNYVVLLNYNGTVPDGRKLVARASSTLQ